MDTDFMSLTRSLGGAQRSFILDHWAATEIDWENVSRRDIGQRVIGLLHHIAQGIAVTSQYTYPLAKGSAKLEPRQIGLFINSLKRQFYKKMLSNSYPLVLLPFDLAQLLPALATYYSTGSPKNTAFNGRCFLLCLKNRSRT
jgi:hypothetical protein